ncbi:hypothetical protein [Clostridium gasigenes]|uniref:Uncharacterized protein n=1 Tax=Clostridium gasigenes TaxID=94869 RepID=A0A7X0SEZ5_9CLOT|nr:hypothetical protein [Clostridium gasigenes]MBB6716376.1 hypothetical protein [Clostridium gasigenes]
MSYVKTNWENRIVEKPKTFRQQPNVDGTITLIPEEGSVIKEGTPVNASNMNKIEDELVANSSQLENIQTQLPLKTDKTVFDTFVATKGKPNGIAGLDGDGLLGNVINYKPTIIYEAKVISLKNVKIIDIPKIYNKFILKIDGDKAYSSSSYTAFIKINGIVITSTELYGSYSYLSTYYINANIISGGTITKQYDSPMVVDYIAILGEYNLIGKTLPTKLDTIEIDFSGVGSNGLVRNISLIGVK